ncbi:MAG: hypothetical protein K2I36_00970 [Ureaplasma sp.]|nr:hypothetical protein [Ureaplasma sp.]
MDSFNLQIKLNKIMTEYKIPTNDQFNFENYSKYLKEKINEYKENVQNELTFNTYSSLIDKLINEIFILKHIESNYTLFTNKIDAIIAKKLKQDGYQIPDDEFKNFINKTDKDVILNIYKVNKINNKRIIRLNFSLIDKKFSKTNIEFYNANLASLINSIDKYKFTNSWLDIKKQTNYRDKLFATITIDIDEDNVCEMGSLWLLRTTWACKYKKVFEIIKQYCLENNIKYHFPYKLSIKWINDVLKNYNYSIINNFLQLQEIFTNLRFDMNQSLKQNTSENHKKFCKKFSELYSEISDLLLNKINLLEQLIFLNKADVLIGDEDQN